MEFGFLNLIPALFLYLLKVQSLELLANYKFWDSISPGLAYDHSGYSHHGFLSSSYIHTDRGLSTDSALTLTISSIDFTVSPIYQELVFSIWILLTHSSTELQLHNTAGPSDPSITIQYSSNDTLLGKYGVPASLSLVNFNPSSPSSYSSWRFYTVRAVIDSINSSVDILIYINMMLEMEGSIINLPFSINSISFELSANNIVYEAWVYKGLTSASELGMWIKHGRSCDCDHACVTSPVVACLPSYGWDKNVKGESCSSDCLSYSSCDTKGNCISNSNSRCKYGLYSLHTSECLFYCPLDSCICDSNLHHCSCKEGFTKLSNSPLACISSHCLSYHIESSIIICDEVESNYDLTSSGECCICDSVSIPISFEPLICFNIPHCLAYIQLDLEYVCTACEERYALDDLGACTLCEIGYIKIDNICMMKIEHCNEYYDNRCKVCKEGYMLSSYNRCDQCEKGFINISDNSLVCIAEITNCIEYEYNNQEAKCVRCEVGYRFDDNQLCNRCEVGYYLTGDSPMICSEKLGGCERHDYIEEEARWVCVECSRGYVGVMGESLVCGKKIDYCEKYGLVGEEVYCEECREGFDIGNEEGGYGNECRCRKGGYVNDEGLCLKCPSFCTECIQDSVLVRCIECDSDHLLRNSICSAIPHYIPSSSSTQHICIILHSSLIISSILFLIICLNITLHDLDSILSLIGTLYILRYTMLYNLHIPERTQILLKNLSLYELVPNIFTYLIQTESRIELERYNRLGIESEIFMINSGKILTLLGILTSFYIGLCIVYEVYTLKQNSFILKRIARRGLELMEWNIFIGLIQTSSIELVCNAVINLYYASFSTIPSMFGIIFSAIVLILLLLSPILLYYYYILNYDFIQNNTSNPQYSILYNTINTKNIECLYLNILLLIRRLVFGVNIVLLYSSPYIQVVLNSSITAGILQFIAVNRPYKTKLENIIGIGRESMILGLQVLIGGFVFEEIMEEAEEIIDWSLVGIIYSSLFIPAGLIMYRIGVKISIFFTRRAHTLPPPSTKLVEEQSDIINITFSRTVF